MELLKPLRFWLKPSAVLQISQFRGSAVDGDASIGSNSVRCRLPPMRSLRMSRCRLPSVWWVSIALVSLWTGSVLAATPESPEARGLRALGELQCTACHALSPTQSAWVLAGKAPNLRDGAGSFQPEWIRQHLLSPQSTMTGSRMPDVLHSLPAAERDAAAESLTHFLVVQATDRTRTRWVDRAAVKRGETLFHQVGCVACHAPQSGAPNVLGSVPLPRMESKWTHEGLRLFLLNPAWIRPAGRMPSLRLTDSEATDIAHYLLREVRVPAPLERIRFEGRIHSLDDFDTAIWSRTEPVRGFRLEPAPRERGGPQRFRGWIQVDQAGEYRFFLKANGASRLALDDDWTLGTESWDTESVDDHVARTLSVGRHAITLDYVHRGPKPADLSLEWQGPGVSRGPIAEAQLSAGQDPVPAIPTFAVDAAKATQGHALYDQLKCAGCHEPEGKQPEAMPWASLRGDQGCLATTPPPTAAQFHLTETARTELRSALTFLNQPQLPAPTPRDQLHTSLAVLRCTACHKRYNRGGVPADRDPFFTSNGEDLGEEGRIPPALDGVGDKLQPAWLKRVLTEGVRVRPYINTRMPVFGRTETAPLADRFVALDRTTSTAPIAPEPVEVQKAAGRQLVGTDGVSCIACHRFNRQPAQALQVIDLVTSQERLHADWFARFLRDPARFHPATRMPAFWPDGVSPLPALLGGSTDRQIAAIWTYLADGALSRAPEGLSRQSMEVIVGGDPVVYRGKLWEAGFRAVAMGFPGGWNLAFDAEDLRLALLWRGRFLNAGPHWDVQGMGQIRPLGSNVVIEPHLTAMATLALPDAPWPRMPGKFLGMKFHGYQLDPAGYPTLLYSFGELKLEDRFGLATSGEPGGIHRTLRWIGEPPKGLHLRLTVGPLLAEGKNGWRQGSGLLIRGGPHTTPIARGTGATQELIVPLSKTSPTRTLELDYAY